MRRMTNDDLPVEAKAVLDFWFGDGETDRPEWFRKDAAFDDDIRRRFGTLIERALAGDLSAWDASPRSALARILVLDQFTRNAFRDDARAFAGDPQALTAARQMVVRGFDRALTPLQRSFAYLPFEHAESAEAQAESMRLFGALADEAPVGADRLAWAARHAQVIARFGRYPHRNALLGRESTADEVAFLAEPGSRF